MPRWHRAAQLRLVIAFQEHQLARRIDDVALHSESAQDMMYEWSVSDVEGEEVRRAWKFRMQRQANESALPVVGDVQRERRCRQQAAALPDEQLPSLISDENAAIRGRRNRGGGIEVGRKRLGDKAGRHFDRESTEGRHTHG